MSRLASLQGAFQRCVLEDQRELNDLVVGTDKIDAATRVGIYTEAYRLRLIECLQENYPALHTLLGDEQFDELGRTYISAHRSHHFSIRWYGDRLDEFLGKTAPWKSHEALAEMAGFEWRLRGAFDAADQPSIGLEALEAIAPQRWPEMVFNFHPSLRRLDLRCNVAAFWRAVDAEKDPPELEQADVPAGWLIWRKALRQYFRSLTVDEAFALDAARRGESFAAICELLCEWIDAQHVSLHAAGLLKRWVTDGLVVDVQTRR